MFPFHGEIVSPPYFVAQITTAKGNMNGWDCAFNFCSLEFKALEQQDANFHFFLIFSKTAKKNFHKIFFVIQSFVFNKILFTKNCSVNNDLLFTKD